MPANLEDPSSPTIYRISGSPPFPSPSSPFLPPDIHPRQVTLRDRQTVATIIPLASAQHLPTSLLVYLCAQYNKEIEGGDVYPITETFSLESFTQYWFQNFGAVMLLGSLEGVGDVVEGKDWSKECLGSFYIKPNYPGRSSHICNAGFLVTDASRNRGVGRLMGETYIDYAPRLGYTYSVFNLVYETNVASCRIWDALGFKRIGRVKGAGNLKSHPDRYIDAIIYGRDLATGESDDAVAEERFDKIKYYLKWNKYPKGADRAEKSRLRSAATHYKLLDDDKLMLKDKEVISDPRKQFDIARKVHEQAHGGINKTTATIAEKFHWSRIKETVSDVIRNCTECSKAEGKAPISGATRRKEAASAGTTPSSLGNGGAESTEQSNGLSTHGAVVSPQVPTTGGMGLQDHPHNLLLSQQSSSSSQPVSYADPAQISSVTPSHTLHDSSSSSHPHQPFSYEDPQHDGAYQPIDPQMMDQNDNPYEQFNPHPADFQALLNATEEMDGDDAAVDRDLDMLIEQGDDEDAERRDDDVLMGDHNGRGEKALASYDAMSYGEQDDSRWRVPDRPP